MRSCLMSHGLLQGAVNGANNAEDANSEGCG